MKKDDSNVGEWAKHVRNTKYGKRGINKRNRKNGKAKVQKEDASR